MMRFLYSVLLYLLLPFIMIKLLTSSITHTGYRKRLGERFGHIDFQQSARPVIWLHAVSVGEVQAARPLADRLLKQYPHYRLLITTTTPTGAATVRRLFGDAVEHFYLPYDLPHAVNKFISSIKPALLIIMETELWPNLLHYCKAHGTHTALVNARLSDRSYAGYKKCAALVCQTLAKFDLLIAQTDKDARRLIRLGARPAAVHVSPNLKYNITIASSVYEQGEAMRRLLSPDRPVFMAASTHEGEEQILFEAYREIRKNVPDCLLMLAPRHPDRAAAIRKIALGYGLSVALRSQPGDYHKDSQLFLIDSLGELPVFYACADVAFVGGSLVPLGGHNVLEPAAIGLPVITGRHVANFQEIVDNLKQHEAIVVVAEAGELVTAVLQFIADANKRHGYGERAREVISANQDGARRIMERLQAFLAPEKRCV